MSYAKSSTDTPRRIAYVRIDGRRLITFFPTGVVVARIEPLVPSDVEIDKWLESAE